MSFSINSNTPSLQSNNLNSINSQKQNKSLNALSSGSNLIKAANDAASLAISEKLLAMVSGSGQAIANSNESIGMIQVADGALGGIEENVQKIKQLTIQASNGTLNDGDRAIIQKEIDSLVESSNDIATSTSFNGSQLLDGTGGSAGDGTFTTQTGATADETSSFSIADVQAAALFGGPIDITTEAGRNAAFDSLESAADLLSSTRADLGSAQNSLISNIKNTSLGEINQAASASGLGDVDFAQESANFSQANLMAQIGSFAQAQANASKANILGVLG